MVEPSPAHNLPMNRQLFSRWPRRALAALATCSLAASQTTSLQSAPAVLDNGIVRFVFTWSPTFNLASVIVTDLVTNHSYRTRQNGLWRFEVLEHGSPGTSANPNLTTIDPSLSTVPPDWAVTTTPQGQDLVMTWVGRGHPDLETDTIDVTLHAHLANGADGAILRLEGTSSMQKNSFWSGGLVFAIEDDQAPELGVDMSFLDPFGFVTVEPATNLPEWSLGTDKALPGGALRDPLLGVMPQLAAVYDTQGNGLYFAGRDETGRRAKAIEFRRIEPTVAFQPPLFEYVSKFYTDDVFNPTSQFASPDFEVARFQGDWFDAAKRYRDWIDTTPIAAGGLIATRTDVSEAVKRAQQTLVLGISTGDYNRPIYTLPSRIETYKNHYSLDHITSLQFGAVWNSNATCSTGPYDASPAWAANALLMENAGLPLLLYFLDHEYAFNPFYPNGNCVMLDGLGQPLCTIGDEYYTQGWEAVTTVNLQNQLQQSGGCGPGLPARRMIEAGSTKWLNHIDPIVNFLASSWGIDGMYIDNIIPVVGEVDFERTGLHGHAPGFSDDFVGGLAAFMGRTNSAGAAGSGTGFSVFTEGEGQEAFIPACGSMGSEREIGDFLIQVAGAKENNPSTRKVPLKAYLYHHLALGRSAAPYDPFMTGGADNRIPASTRNISASEARRGLRGMSYSMAYSAVNGNVLRCPDQLAQFSPSDAPWSFERPPTFSQPYKTAVSFGARLSAFRGVNGIHEFLNVGRRERDLAWLTPPPDVIAPLPVSPTEAIEEQTVPKLLHSVWTDPLTGHVGIAIINHTATTSPLAQFIWNPTDYGLTGGTTYQVTEVFPDGTMTPAGSLTGVTPLQVAPQPKRSMRFLRIAP